MRGNAPVSNKDGKPIEIHHNDQKPLGPFDEMHPSDHRYGENYKKIILIIIKKQKLIELNLENGNKNIGNMNGIMEGGTIRMKQYEYFKNVEENAVFTKESCQFCGHNDNCLEGIYFEQPGLKSVCLSCLDKRIIGVEIPDYLKNKVQNNVEKIEKLKYTPPVPWVQYNDWPVCCDDYMQYLGEWTQEDFIRKSRDGNGISLFQSLLNIEFMKQVDDINVLWNDLENNTVAFVFICPVCNTKKVVCQSY